MKREVASAYCIVRLEILSHYVKGSLIRSWIVHKRGELPGPVTESDMLNTLRPTGHKPCKYARYVAKSWNTRTL